MSNCPQAWHGGLPIGLLMECKYQEKHRGKHRNEAGNLEWTGKLTDEEMAQAEELRGKEGGNAAMTVYIVEYRTRKKGWIPTQEFDSLDKATEVKDDAVKYEKRGTKDWRVRARV